MRYTKTLDKRMKEITAQEIGKSITSVNKLYSTGKLLKEIEAKDIGIATDIVENLPKPLSI